MVKYAGADAGMGGAGGGPAIQGQQDLREVPRAPRKHQVLGAPAMTPGAEKGSKGRNWLDCIRGKGVRASTRCFLPPALRAGSNRPVHGPLFALALAGIWRLVGQIKTTENDDVPPL